MKKRFVEKRDREDIVKFDSLFSQYIRARDKNTCLLCGSKTRLSNSHLVTRQVTILRWDELNCHTHCWGCNKRHTYHPEIYTAWFLRTYGVEAYLSLVNKALLKFPLPDEAQIAVLHKEYTLKLAGLWQT